MKKMIIIAALSAGIVSSVLGDDNENAVGYMPSTVQEDTLCVDCGTTLKVYYSHMMRRCGCLDATVTKNNLIARKGTNWKENWYGCVRAHEPLNYTVIANAYKQADRYGNYQRYRAVPCGLFMSNKSAFDATGYFSANFPASDACVLQLQDIFDEVWRIIYITEKPARIHVSFANSEKWIGNWIVNIPAYVYVSVSHPCLNYCWKVQNLIEDDCGCGSSSRYQSSTIDLSYNVRFYNGLDWQDLFSY